MPIFVATRLGDLNELVPNLRVYREAWAAAGHPGNGKVYLRVPVYIAATEKQAREEPHESVMYFYQVPRRTDRGVSGDGRRPSDRKPRGTRSTAAAPSTMRKCCSSKIIVGTPAMVADRLAQLQDELGLSGILAEMNCGMRIPNERVVNSLRLMCQKVIPQFRS